MRDKKRRFAFAPAFITGLVIVAAVTALIVFGLRTLLAPDTMLDPDGDISGAGEVLDPYLEPALSELTAGRLLMGGPISLVVKHDIPYFENPDEISDEYLLSMGVWLCLYDGELSAGFEYSESGEILVPATNVFQKTTAYFALSDERKSSLHHKTVEIYGSFVYDENESAYVVPVYGMESLYAPRVRSVVSIEGGYDITLDYLSSADIQLGDIADTSLILAQKVAVLVTENTETGYRVLALRDGSQGDQ